MIPVEYKELHGFNYRRISGIATIFSYGINEAEVQNNVMVFLMRKIRKIHLCLINLKVIFLKMILMIIMDYHTP